MKQPWIKITTIVLAVLAVVLTILLLTKRCKCGEQYSSNLPKFVPAGDSGGKWSNSDDQQKCLTAFQNVDMTCQSNPNSDKIACSDFPMFFCNGELRASGDMNYGNCPYGSAVAYSADECSNPRTVRMDGSYLCGGLLDPCVDKEKTGMNCKAPAPPNQWNATNVCHPA